VPRLLISPTRPTAYFVSCSAIHLSVRASRRSSGRVPPSSISSWKVRILNLAQDFGGLAQDTRDLVKTGDVVLIVFNGIQRDGERKIRKAGMDAVLLVDGHLILFEIEVSDALREDTNEEVVRKLILIGEASRGDRFEPGKEVSIGLVILSDGVEGTFAQLVVITVVAEGGGALGKIAEIGLILLVEECVLGGEAVGHGFSVLGEDGSRKQEGEDKRETGVKAHRCSRVPERGMVENRKLR
jgi:hypothetical protein